MVKYINIGQGLQTIVDDVDYEWASKMKWRLDKNPSIRNKYAIRTVHAPRKDGKRGASKTIRLHRLVIKCPPELFVDHINGDTLDNRKENLRLCTQRQNNCNRESYGQYTFKGIKKDGRGWTAAISVNNKAIYLGYFTNSYDAAVAYNTAAIKYNGEFARVNKLPLNYII